MITVFLAQFAYILLLGWQSRNVRDGDYGAAALTSFALFWCGLYLTGVIARQSIIASDWRVIFAYIIAGPLAICVAIWSHDRWKHRCPIVDHDLNSQQVRSEMPPVERASRVPSHQSPSGNWQSDTKLGERSIQTIPKREFRTG